MKPDICYSHIALALTLIFLVGCQEQPFQQKVEQTPYLGLPANLEEVHSIDLSRLRPRPNFRQLWNEVTAQGELAEIFTNLRERIGFRPLQDVDQIIFGKRRSSDRLQPLKQSVIIVRGRFPNPEEKLEKLRLWLAEQYLIAPPPFKRSVHGGTSIVKFQTRGQSQYNENVIYDLFFAFPSESLMVFAFSNDIFTESLDVISGAIEGINVDENWRRMLLRPDIGSALWGTGNLPPTPPETMTMFPALKNLSAARQFYYTVNYGEELKVEIGLVCESIDQAKNLVATLKEAIRQMQTLAAQIKDRAPETAELPEKIVVLQAQETAQILLLLRSIERKALVDEWQRLTQQAGAASATPPPVPAPVPPQVTATP